MNKPFGYYILMALTWPMQLFPLEFHYILSDFLYLLVYKLFGYRKNVVHQNLVRSFPDKSNDEIQKIEKQFYHNFCDMFIETLYFTHINAAKEAQRLDIKGIEEVEKYIAEGRNILALTGHFGNWEFMQLFINKLPIKTYYVYKKLNNKTFDAFYRELRSRAAHPLEMQQTYRQLAKDKVKKNPFAAYLISDQRPRRYEVKHWVTFMNQDTPVMLGPEKIAQKTNASVFYVELKQIKRGYHRVSFELLADQPEKTDQYQITDQFMKRLEQSIHEAPHQYFWTHKRWRFKKEEFN